ncbi:hypothetical protein [Bacillus sp. FJAT-49736]|uniref:hypothetical protein n=1 Tax=Bacillus sp. FJAT-49736 TaxID=2833582 RepID=UPI0020165B82|nr:hypothetical protein [Bacillus sp. FJAT-49736]
MIAFLIFSITASAGNHQTANACFHAMTILAKTSVRASTIGTTITGIILSVGTKWGLFRYYWILAKEGLTLLVIAINLWGMQVWTLQAFTLSTENQSVDVINQAYLWTGICLQIFSLAVMYAISVYKPWGRRIRAA